MDIGGTFCNSFLLYQILVAVVFAYMEDPLTIHMIGIRSGDLNALANIQTFDDTFSLVYMFFCQLFYSFYCLYFVEPFPYLQKYSDFYSFIHIKTILIFSTTRHSLMN